RRTRPASRAALWTFLAPTTAEVICHNDWAPWNALFRERRLVVMLDWDMAGPGSRLWDVANSAYSWVPLFSEGRRSSPIDDRARRLRLFCDAYRLFGARVAPRCHERAHALRERVCRGASPSRRQGLLEAGGLGRSPHGCRGRRIPRRSPRGTGARSRLIGTINTSTVYRSA